MLPFALSSYAKKKKIPTLDIRKSKEKVGSYMQFAGGSF
jgi:hypothetical protein